MTHNAPSIMAGVMVVAVWALAPLSKAQSPAARRAADRPEAVPEASWRQAVGRQQRILTNQPCQVCFIGDSLTEFWQHTGKAEWDVLTLPPSGNMPGSALRQRIQQTNALLKQSAWPATVRVLEVYDTMVDANDRWLRGLTLDGTHFSASGYAKLAELIEPVVNELLRESGTDSLQKPDSP